MAYSEEKFREAIREKRIPVLVLDNKWHKLFKKTGTTDEIVRLEGELTELLKRQGKVNTDVKGLKKIKSDLMNDIVTHMNDGEQNASQKSDAEKKILELPRKIEEVNRELMIHTMELCYDKLSANTDEIEEIADWIHNIRIELKKNLIKKQEKEYYNAELYSFMHDIFGPDVVELFDMRYEPQLRRNTEQA